MIVSASTILRIFINFCDPCGLYCWHVNVVVSTFIEFPQVYLCRNSKGELDSSGDIWGAPYRWGTMVIAYKKSKFRKHNLKPIEVTFFFFGDKTIHFTFLNLPRDSILKQRNYSMQFEFVLL